MRRRGPVKRALFAVVLLALLCGLLEAGSFVAWWLLDGEMFSPSRVRRRQEELASEAIQSAAADRSIAVALHPYLGYVLDPADFPDARVTPNGHGFPLAASPIRSRQPNQLIVALLGGSVAMQLAPRLGDALRERADLRGIAVEVVPLAMEGYKQPQPLIALGYLASLGAEFDVVVCVDGFNELVGNADNVARRTYPFFPGHWNALATSIPAPAVRRALGRLELSRAERAAAARTFLAAPLTVTLALVWRALDARHGQRIVAARQQLQQVSTAQQAFALSGPPVPSMSESELNDATARVWQQSSLLLRQVSLGIGAQYHHFLQPNQYVPGSKPLTAAERRSAFLEDQPLAHAVRTGYPALQRAGEQLRAKGVSFHDMTRLFAGNEETLYADTCCHLNDLGNRILARAIAAIVAPPAAADVSRSAAAVASLESPAATLTLSRPLQTVRLEIAARDPSGGVRTVAGDRVSLRSSDPGIVRCLQGGAIEARRAGAASVTAEYAGHTLPFSITVEYPPVVSFGIGAAQLEVDLHDETATFSVAGPGARTGVLLGSFEIDRLLWCGHEMYVPVVNALSLPLAAADARAALRVPLPPSCRGRTTFWQALLRGDAGCGWVASNGVAVTLPAR